MTTDLPPVSPPAAPPERAACPEHGPKLYDLQEQVWFCPECWLRRNPFTSETPGGVQ